MVYVYVYYGGYAVHAAGEKSDASQTAKYLSEERSFEATGHYEVELRWNLMAHGDAREGKWRGNKRMEWVANTRALCLGTWSIQHGYHYYRWSALLDCQ